MGITKSDYFNDQQNHLAEVLKSLAHPARIAILQHLVKVNSCVCGDLVDELPLAQATVSQHLKELKHAGLIKGNTEGNSVCYCIDPIRWKEIQESIQQLFESFRGGENCC